MTLTDMQDQASHVRRELAATEQRAKDAIAETLQGKKTRAELANVLGTANTEAHRLRGILHTLSKQIDVQQAYPVIQGFAWSIPMLLEAFETLTAMRGRVTTLRMPIEPDGVANGLRRFLRDCEAWLARQPAPQAADESPAAVPKPARRAGRKSRRPSASAQEAAHV